MRQSWTVMCHITATGSLRTRAASGTQASITATELSLSQVEREASTLESLWRFEQLHGLLAMWTACAGSRSWTALHIGVYRMDDRCEWTERAGGRKRGRARGFGPRMVCCGGHAGVCGWASERRGFCGCRRPVGGGKVRRPGGHDGGWGNALGEYQRGCRLQLRHTHGVPRETGN